jgi:dihydropteroate synthase
MKPYTLRWPGHEMALGGRSRIMGVVNVTPDSFSDGGRYLSTEAAVEQGLLLADAGADILDIGGESTRPFSDPVPPDEELRRVVPVIERLAKQVEIPISIDTAKAVVAEKALAAGASIINDISALRMDADMAAVAARSDAPVIVMHMQGTPGDMQLDPTYEDVVSEVVRFLSDTIDAAVARGIRRSNLIVDPGIGFGKTGKHNLLLLKRLDALAALDAPVLVGTSRKRFIRDILKPDGTEDIPPGRPEVETGTQATVAAAVLNGAHIVRVHDVADTASMLKVLDAIRLAD